MLSYLFPSHATSIHTAKTGPSIATADDGTLSIRLFIEKHCPAVLGSFRPSIWLPNGHAQTAYCVMGNFENIDHVEYERKYIRLPDGGTIGVDFTPPLSQKLDPNTPVILVAHGLTGGSYEAYVRHVLSKACAPTSEGGLGYRAAVLNFRGCAGVPLTSPRFYSAAATDDYACGALYVSRMFPQAKLLGLGFSLGANVVTRYLGEEGEKSRLTAGCALACPWNLVSNSYELEGRWFNRTIYSKAMGNNLLKLYSHHLDSIKTFKGSHLLSIHDQVLALKSPRLIDVDELLVSQTGGPAPNWPFIGAMDYYKHASSDQMLPHIRVPYLAMSAEDDPIVRVIPRPDEDESVQASSYVAVAITKGGGHLGWFEDGGLREVRRWIRGPVLQWMKAIVEEYMPNGNVKGREVEQVDGFVREVGRENIGYKEIEEGDLPRHGPNVKGLTTGL